MRFAVIVGCLLAIPAVAPAQRGSPDASTMRPGDRVLVRVWMDSSFADTARIDTRGLLVLPALGALPVQGLGPSAVADSVRRAYDRILRQPAVEATPLRRVVVSGEVKRPGVYFLEPQSTIREAIAIAGGITELGLARTLRVSRDSGLIRVKDWDRRADALIQSGDVIWIGRESWLRRNSLTVVSGMSVLLSLIITLSR